MAFSIPESTIEEIRQRTDLVELIGSRIPLKRAGASYKACCPFHHEKSPSFHVNPTTGLWKCFGCGAGGDVDLSQRHRRYARRRGLGPHLY